MPSSTSPNMGLFLPVPSVTAGPQWASELVTNLSTLDTHDHTTGKGVAIPLSALTVNADFSLLNFGLTNVGYESFTQLAGTGSIAVNNSLASTGGQPYWRDSSGVVKKLQLVGDVLGLTGGGTGQTTAVAALDALHGAIATIASASTTDLGTATGENVSVTGTVTIASFGTLAAGVVRRINFTGALTITYNATSMILPDARNMEISAGDTIEAVSLGSGNWRVYLQQGAKSLAGQGTSALPSFAFRGAAGTGMFYDSANTAPAFSVGGTYFMLLRTTGILDMQSAQAQLNLLDVSIGRNGVDGYMDVLLNSNGRDMVIGNPTALSTSATTGFIQIPTCAGAPTGAPTLRTGKAALVYDTTNSKLWARFAGTWKGVVLT